MPLGSRKTSKDDKDFRQIFQELYQRDYRKWLGYAIRKGLREDLAEAAVQEMSVRILQAEERLSDLSMRQLTAYIMATLKNAIYDQWKREREDADSVAAPLGNVVELFQEDPQEQVLDRMEYEELRQRVSGLPDLYKSYLYYRYYMGYSNQEIGQRMHSSEGTVRMLKHRAVKMLRKQLEAEKRRRIL